MADAIRTRAALQSLLADNASGDISAQDVRDFLVSTYNWVNKTVGGKIYYTEGWVGIQTTDPQDVLHLSDLALGEGIKLQAQSGGLMDDQAWGLKVGIGGVDGRYFTIYDYARTGGGSTGHRLVIADETGYIGMGGVTDPSETLDATGNIKASGFFDAGGDSMRIRTSQSPLSGGAGNQGEIAWDGTYFYGCVNTNTWGRIAWTLGY